MTIEIPISILEGGYGGATFEPLLTDSTPPYNNGLTLSPHAYLTDSDLGEQSFLRVAQKTSSQVTKGSRFSSPDGLILERYAYQNCVNINKKWLISCPFLLPKKAFYLPSGTNTITLIDPVSGVDSTDPNDGAYTKVVQTCNSGAFFVPWNNTKGYVFYCEDSTGRRTEELPGAYYSVGVLMDFPFMFLGTSTNNGFHSVVYDYARHKVHLLTNFSGYLRNLLGGYYSPFSKVLYVWDKNNRLIAIDFEGNNVSIVNCPYNIKGYRRIIPLHREAEDTERFLLIPGGLYYDEFEDSPDYRTLLIEISFNTSKFAWQKPIEVGALSHGYFSSPAYFPSTGEMLIPSMYPGKPSYLFVDIPSFPVSSWRSYAHPWI